MDGEQVVKVGSLDFNTIRIVDNNGETQSYNISDMLSFNENNYEVAYTEQAASYVYWASVYAITKEQEESANNLLDKVHADQYAVAFNRLSGTGARPTKDAIESVIIQSPQYQDQKKVYFEAKRLAMQLQYLVKAFEQRRDMLIQFGAERRKLNTVGN